MPLIRACFCLLAIVALGLGRPVDAQVRPRPNIPFITGTVGLGNGSGSGYLQRTTIDLEVYGGELFHGRRKYSLVGGGFAGLTYAWSDDRYVCPPSTEPGRCGTVPPTIEYLGASFGFETSPLENATSMGVTIGPAFVQTSRLLEKDNSGAAPSRTAGIQIRIEGVRRLTPNRRLVFAIRNLYMPNYQGRKLNLGTIAIGMRFQRFQPFN